MKLEVQVVKKVVKNLLFVALGGCAISMNKKYLDDFIICLNEDRYFDAHEALEAIWFPRRFEKSDEIRLLRGYINAAVSFELVKRGRLESAIKVFKTYKKYKILLCEIEPMYYNKYLRIQNRIENLVNEKQWLFLDL